MSRLIGAAYDGKDKYGTSYSYDKHGNFATIKRYGNAPSNLMDNLSFSYTGNQLINIKESGVNNSGSQAVDFRDYSSGNGLMAYNRNGALVSDTHRGVSTAYNSLNLPMQTTVNNNLNKGNIKYTYSAVGTKLKVQYSIESETQIMPIIVPELLLQPELLHERLTMWAIRFMRKQEAKQMFLNRC